MKRFILIFLSICILSCDKDELPEETQIGKNTFGMLINEIPWQLYNPRIFTLGNKSPNIFY